MEPTNPAYAAESRLVKGRNDIEQCCLARPGRAHNGNKLALIDRKADVFKRDTLPCPQAGIIDLFDMIDL